MAKKQDLEFLIKSFSISFLFVAISFIFILGGLYFFTILISDKLSEFMLSIPLQYTWTYGGLATVLTWINKRYPRQKEGT